MVLGDTEGMACKKEDVIEMQNRLNETGSYMPVPVYRGGCTKESTRREI